MEGKRETCKIPIQSETVEGLKEEVCLPQGRKGIIVYQGFKQGPKCANMWYEPGTASKGEQRASERILLAWFGEGGNVPIQPVCREQRGRLAKGAKSPPSLTSFLFLPSLSPSLLCSFLLKIWVCIWNLLISETANSFYCINTMWAKQTVPASPEQLTSPTSEASEKQKGRRRLDSQGPSAKQKSREGRSRWMLLGSPPIYNSEPKGRLASPWKMDSEANRWRITSGPAWQPLALYTLFLDRKSVVKIQRNLIPTAPWQAVSYILR